MATLHTNKDGLSQWFGTRDVGDFPVSRKTNDIGALQHLIVDFDYTHIGLTTATWFDEDAGGGSTPDRPSQLQAALPANAYIKTAHLIIKTAFTSGGTPTMNIGTYLASGVVINADAIDATIAMTAIDAIGDAVVCDGTEVGGVISVGTVPAYIAVDSDDATYTAGSARLVIAYYDAANA